MFIMFNIVKLKFTTRGFLISYSFTPIMTYYDLFSTINPLNTKRRLLYLKTQSVPRSKHFSSLL